MSPFPTYEVRAAGSRAFAVSAAWVCHNSACTSCLTRTSTDHCVRSSSCGGGPSVRSAIGQHPSVWLKVAVDGRDPGSGAHNQVLAPLRTHGLLIGSHGRIGVVLIRQRKNRYDPAPIVFVL